MIDLKPDVSKTANLKQAIEWVAFEMEPLTPEYNGVYREARLPEFDEVFEEDKLKNILNAKRKIFTALRKGYLSAGGEVDVPIYWDSGVRKNSKLFRLDDTPSLDKGLDWFQKIKQQKWVFENIYWNESCLIYNKGNVDENWFAYRNIVIESSELFKLFPSEAMQREISKEQEEANKYYLNMGYWTVEEACKIMVGLSIHQKLDGIVDEQIKKFFQLKTLFERSRNGGFGVIYDNTVNEQKVIPEKCLVSAKEKGIRIPASLEKVAIEKGLLCPDVYNKEISPKMEETSGYRTSYIQDMLKAISELKITDDNQPSKSEIEYWFETNTEGYSKKEIDKLASFIRHPESQKGGYYKRRVPPKKVA
ncbi:MAG: hypothetical protein AB7U85_11250 [Alphaproteobacteria bacterium]